VIFRVLQVALSVGRRRWFPSRPNRLGRNPMKRKLVIAAVATSVVIGGGAAVALADDGPRSGGTKVQAAGADTGAGTGAGAAQVTAAEAVTAALQHTPGTAVSADREDDGRDAWEVDVVKSNGTEYTVKVSPTDGHILSAHRDAADDDARHDLTILKNTTVNAREAAQSIAPKGTVTEVDLDDDGPAVWNVETTGGEWKVDAHTGKITQDRDHDKDHGDDHGRGHGDDDDRDDD
jgi:uncharacterized membrane protein YkoI